MIGQTLCHYRITAALGAGGMVSADGQRFLVKEPIEAAPELQMHVVLNWESLLEPEE